MEKAQTIHAILIATDSGQPALTRYQRVVVEILPNKMKATAESAEGRGNGRGE